MACTIRFIGLFWQFESFVIRLNQTSSGPKDGARILIKNSSSHESSQCHP